MVRDISYHGRGDDNYLKWVEKRKEELKKELKEYDLNNLSEAEYNYLLNEYALVFVRYYINNAEINREYKVRVKMLVDRHVGSVYDINLDKLYKVLGKERFLKEFKHEVIRHIVLYNKDRDIDLSKDTLEEILKEDKIQKELKRKFIRSIGAVYKNLENINKLSDILTDEYIDDVNNNLTCTISLNHIEQGLKYDESLKKSIKEYDDYVKQINKEEKEKADEMDPCWHGNYIPTI